MNATLQMTTHETVRKGVPSAVWVASVALGVVGVTQVLLAFWMGMPLAIAGVLALILAIGVFHRQRWAHAMTLAVCVLTIPVLIAQGEPAGALAVTAFNAVIWVPLLIAWKWFWKRDHLPEWLA